LGSTYFVCAGSLQQPCESKSATFIWRFKLNFFCCAWRIRLRISRHCNFCCSSAGSPIQVQECIEPNQPRLAEFATSIPCSILASSPWRLAAGSVLFRFLLKLKVLISENLLWFRALISSRFTPRRFLRTVRGWVWALLQNYFSLVFPQLPFLAPLLENGYVSTFVERCGKPHDRFVDHRTGG
jgi:hypothetical protein